MIVPRKEAWRYQRMIVPRKEAWRYQRIIVPRKEARVRHGSIETEQVVATGCHPET
jgi:hypothetical protein